MFLFQLLLSQRAGLEWHEELETVSVQAGLKGKKLSKVCSSQKKNHHIVVLVFQVFQNRFNLIALRKAKIAYNFGLSECNWVKRVTLWYMYLYFKIS